MGDTATATRAILTGCSRSRKVTMVAATVGTRTYIATRARTSRCGGLNALRRRVVASEKFERRPRAKTWSRTLVMSGTLIDWTRVMSSIEEEDGEQREETQRRQLDRQSCPAR